MYKPHKLVIAAAVAAATALSCNAQAILESDAYSWRGDTIFQAEYKAWAPSATEIQSTYSARPGYFMPVEKRWTLKNDISSYPQLSTSNKLHQAIYNMGLDEMVNAVEPDTTLRTGKEWAGVWTRDVSYSIILSMAYLQPEASMISLRHKVNPNGRIIQDTGSGGAWPISSDRMIWAVAAYEIYKVTGDKKWLEYIYPIIRDSFEDDFKVTYNPESGLVRGETSFIDWREQSYPQWMQTADIYTSEALSTSVVHAYGLRLLADMASDLGYKKEATAYAEKSKQLAEAIDKHFWMPDKGYYGMYLYGRNHPILNPRAETLGESLAILWDVASPEKAAAITANNPTTPFGAAIFYPFIKDMPPYHNKALWPFVGSYWAIANAKAGNEKGLLEAIGAIYRPAALFATNKENFNLENGDIYTELNSSNMLWSLSGNLAITHRILMGITFEKDGLSFNPVVPEALADTRTLTGFDYRGKKINITVKGFGNKVKEMTLNGKTVDGTYIPDKKLRNGDNIVITMADNKFDTLSVNHRPAANAPITPIAWLENSADFDAVPGGNLLRWQPIEYIAKYVVIRDGVPVDTVRTTSYPATMLGEYQVIGIDAAGVESFASEPRSNYAKIAVEMPGESLALKSPEVSYQPQGGVIRGYHGNGFVEVDHKSAPITVDVDVPAAGKYAISLVYANGNGPVNTENKCAIRTIAVNGEKVGTVVMPHRGVANWDDWGFSNAVIANLKEGKNSVTIEFRPEDENMNLSTNHAIIDRILLTPVN